MKKNLKLYSYWVCPFAQRAWIGLERAKLSFEYVELNPYTNRENTEWAKINPKGLVPAITIDGQQPGVPESRICLELINELSNGSLFSSDPAQNAFWRIAGEQVDSKFVPAWYGFLTGKKDADFMTSTWKDFCSKLDLSRGPFCFGQNDIGFVDILIAPFMIRSPVLEKYRSYKIKDILTGSDLEKYTRWENAVMNHTAVKSTLQDSNKIIEKYQQYATGNIGTTKSDVLQKVKDL